VERALEELSGNSGTQFDADVVAAFLRAYGETPARLPIATPRIERRSLPFGIAAGVS
jgi:HD-GYP domain-containing protein (c-di-GMP phosphodiesterase class II)